MRKWLLAVLAAVALTTVSAGAMAQEETTETPWAIRIGALWPTDSAVRDVTDNVWFNAGLDYTFKYQEGNEWIGAVDYTSGDNVNGWIFQVLYKWHNPGSGQDARFSFGIGGAVYLFDPNGGNNQTEYGIPLVADWGMTPSIFLEGKYHWVASDVDLNNFTLQVGYRF